MTCNDCQRIKNDLSGGFMSITEFDRAKSACDSLVASGYWKACESSVYYDLRYICASCGTAWRLELPDAPAPGGLWLKTAAEQRINDLSAKHRGTQSMATSPWPEPSGAGSNNSFKPKPLRGSA
jgi:hypothetical protein